jgi:nicotinamidase-related amidase
MRTSADLHGSAPDDAAVALLVIDMINGFDFPGGARLLRHTRPIAPRIRALAARARRAGIPVVYVNDNFGRWRSDFRAVIAHCLGPRMPGRAVVRALRPHREDYFVLKPRHSGFYSTTLSLLLEHLSARTLILTGVTTDMCVLFTAQDAHVRGYRLVVPADCTASLAAQDTRRALALMRNAMRAVTTRSGLLNLGGSGRPPGPRGRRAAARGTPAQPGRPSVSASRFSRARSTR